GSSGPRQSPLFPYTTLFRSEIQWCLFAYTQRSRPGRWDLTWLQRLANLCRERHLSSLVDLDLEDFPRFCGGIAKIMLHQLRLVRSEEHTSELQSPCNLVCRL